MLRRHSNKNMNLKYFFYNLKKITFVLIPLLTLHNRQIHFLSMHKMHIQILVKRMDELYVQIVI